MLTIGELTNVYGEISSNNQMLRLLGLTQFDNSSGTINQSSDGGLAISADYFLSNASSKLASNGDLSITLSGAYTNHGELSGNLSTTITANNFSNTNLVESKQGRIEIAVGSGELLNDAHGQIKAAQNLDVHASTLRNFGGMHAGQILKLNLQNFDKIGDLSADNLLNIEVGNSVVLDQGDSLTSKSSLILNISGSLTNRGLISSDHVLTMGVSELSNELTGVISGGQGGVSQITVNNILNNKGRVSSQDGLKISAGNLINDQVVNAGNSLNLIGGVITNRGTIFGRNYLFSNNSSINNQGGTIYSGGNMDLTLPGDLTNAENGRIEVVDRLVINAANIFNRASEPVFDAEFSEADSSYHTDVYQYYTDYSTTHTQTIHSTPVAQGDAVIASGGDMELSASLIQNSYGSIYVGGNLWVSGGSLINDSAVEKTTTVSTREVARVYHNPEWGTQWQEPSITEETYGATIVGFFRVVRGIYGNLAHSIENRVNTYSIGRQSGDTSVTGDNTQWRNGSDVAIAQVNNDSLNIQGGVTRNANPWARQIAQSVGLSTANATLNNTAINGQQQLAGINHSISQNTGGHFNAANGNSINLVESQMALHSEAGSHGEHSQASQWLHVQEQNLVGGSNNATGANTDDLVNALGAAAVEQFIASAGGELHNVTSASTSITPVAHSDDSPDALNSIDLAANGRSGVAQLDNGLPSIGDTPIDAASSVAAGEKAQVKGAGIASQSLPQQQAATLVPVLPQGFNPSNAGSLFIRNTAPDSQYLIETRPEFTDYQRFLGSDYLLNSIGYNPDKTAKRLGDAFYENQLIREALQRQTGQRYLGGATNDFEQMQQLMDNALAANQQLQLSVGVALSAAQMAALTENILWVVEQVVDGQKVLVPQLYLASGEKAQLLPNGTVMSAGGKIDLFGKNSVTTSGSLYAGNGLSLRTDGKLEQHAQLNSKVSIELVSGEDFFNHGKLDSQWVSIATGGNFVNSTDGTINGGSVSVKANGDITNQSSIAANDALFMDAGNRLVNAAGGRLVSQGLTSLSAQNDLINQQGYIEGKNIALVSRNGSIINKTDSARISITDAQGRTQTNTLIGPSSTIVSHQNLLLDAAKDLDLRGSQFSAANDISFKAGNDILLNAIENLTETDTSRRGKTDKTSRTEFSVVNINAGGNLNLEAGRDINGEGTKLTGKNGVSLSAGRDLNFSAVAERTQTEHLEKRKKIIDTETHNQLVSIASDGNVVLKAGQDANLTGTNITAKGDVSLAAARDTNISAVVDSDYHYDYTKKKKSFGRSKTTENETLDESILGGEITAGGNLLINAHTNDKGELISDASGNVNLLGTKLNSGGTTVVSADEDVNASGIRYNSLDYHRSKKSGIAGLSKKDKGGTEADQLLQNAEINSQGDVVLMANNLKLVATNIVAKGNIDLDVVDELLVSAGDISRSAKNWNSKSGLLSNGDAYSKTEHRDGEQENGTQASLLQAGGKISGHVGSGSVVGSDLNAKLGVFVVADAGDLSFRAAATRKESYTHDETLSVGFGDVLSSLSRPDQMIKNENGRATLKLADAHIEKADSKTTRQGARNATVVSDGSILLTASAGKVDITGADLTANASKTASGDNPLTNGTLALSGALGINLGTVDTSKQTEVHTLTGDATMSVVVQHQAVEVALAAKNLDDAKDKLSQAKKDYKNYERDLDNQKSNLRQLEADYANHAPGVTLDDLNQLRNRVGDLEQDKAWYQAGLVMAATNMTSATTALVQQLAAAAQSSGTYGFNAGVQLDIDASKSNTKTVDTHQQGNTLSGKNILLQTGAAGTDGKLITKGTQVNIQGSSLIADDRLSIITGDLNILASTDTHQLTNEREHGHVTAQVTVYGASGGASVNGSFDRSRAKESSTSYTNSQLLGNTIDITTSGDATIRGATIRADSQLDADIAGNLTLESVQDRSTSKNNSFGVSGGVSFGGLGSKEKNGQRLENGEKVLSEDSFAYYLHGPSDVRGASGANGGFNVSNGYSDSKQTVLTSLTSGGVANVHVGGHTQLNGALLAALDEDGNDLGLLNFSTKTFGFSDLTNTNTSRQMTGGFSTNANIGGKANSQQQNNAQNDKGEVLNKGTSHVTYKNTSTDDVSKTLATLGHGNVTVGDVQIEKDEKSTEAASAINPLADLNRETSNTNKELWSIKRAQGNIDANIDHRLLTPDGRKDIGEDFAKLSGNVKAISHNVTGVLKDQTSAETIKDNYKFALVQQGNMDEVTADDFIDKLSSIGYFNNQSAIAKAAKANGNLDVADLKNLSLDSTFTLEYNQQLQQAQLASGDVLVTTGKSNALGVVVTDSAAMLNRAVNELPEDKRKAGSEAFNLLTSGPTGYIISKGAERGVQYLPDTAKQTLGKFGEKVDAAITGLSEAGVGFLVSDENKNVSTYYEGTKENRESGQDIAQDRVDGTKMVVGGIITATGASGVWKAASRDGGVAGGAAKDGKKASNNNSKEKQPGLEDNEAGHSEFGGNGGREQRLSEDLSILDKKAEIHILDGDGPSSGGHRYGTGKPGKTEFPQSWDDQKIKNTASEIATDPSLKWSDPDSRGYISAVKNVDGIDVKVIVDSKKGRIVTAYPIGTPKNPKGNK